MRSADNATRGTTQGGHRGGPDRGARPTVTGAPSTRTPRVTTFVEHFHHINGMSNAQTRGETRRRPTTKQVVASRIYNLSLDIAALRQQLQELELHRSLLRTRALFTLHDADGSVLETTVDYWKVFRRGFQAGDSRQLSFIMSVMDSEMRMGLTPHGRDELVLQLELYKEYFAIQRCELHQAIVVARDGVSGTCVTRSDGAFRGRLTRRGLSMVFPAVLNDPDLTQELLAVELCTPVTILLHFNVQGTVFRHDGNADFFGAIRQALGSAARAATIMQNARILEESMVERCMAPEETDQS